MSKKLISLSLTASILMTSCFGPEKSNLSTKSKVEAKPEQPAVNSVNSTETKPATVLEKAGQEAKKIAQKPKVEEKELLKTDLSMTCDLMQNLALPEKREFQVEKRGQQVLYSAINKKKKRVLDYKVEDMVANYRETLPFRAVENAPVFKDKLTYHAIKNILKKQRTLLGIVETKDFKDDFEDLNVCLSESNILEKLVVDTDKLPKGDSEVFLNDLVKVSLDNAIIARVLLKKIAQLEQELETKLEKHWHDQKKDGRGKISAPAKKERKELRNQYAQKINRYDLPLKLIAKNSPVVLRTVNDFKITKWSNVKLEETKFAKLLLKDFDETIIDGIVELVEHTPAHIAISDYSKQHVNPAYTTAYYQNTLKNDKVLKATARKAIEDFVEKTNDGMLTICESKGDQLHHSKSLVDQTFAFNANNNLLFETAMTADHAAYCHLLEAEPKEDLKASNAFTGAGLSTLAAGGVAWVLIGSGVGIPVVAIGGAILLVDTGYNIYTSNELRDAKLALSYGGWIEHREYLDQIGLSYELYSELGADTLITLATGGVGAYIKKASAAAAKAHEIEDIDIAPKFDDRTDEAKEILNAKKFKRGHMNESLLANGSEASIKRYKDLIWKRHDELNTQYDKLESKYNTIVLREWFRRKTGNEIPAFHMFGKSGDETFGILDTIEDASKLTTEQGEKALDTIVNNWFANTVNYASDINNAVDKGFEARKQLPELKAALKKYKTSDFLGGKKHNITLTFVKDGKIVKEDKPFQSYWELDKFAKDQKKLANSTFARNSLEELTTSSDLYRIMDEQAVDIRRIEFLRDTLQGVQNPSRTQQYLLLRSERILARSDIQARADAIHRLEVKELKEESRRYLMVLGNPSKLAKELEFKLSENAAEKIKNSGAAGRWIMGSATFAVGTATVSFTNKYLESGGSFSELKAKGVLRRNEYERSWNNGLTFAESDCAKQPRMFSFSICVYNAVDVALAVQRARAIVTDKNYSFINDAAAVEKAYEIVYKLVKERKRQRRAEIFDLAGTILKTTYPEVTKNEIVNLIKQKSGNHLIALHASKILSAESSEKAYTYLEQAEVALGSDFTYAIRYALENLDDVEKSIKDKGRLPQKLENLILGLTIEEANIDIENEDFFEFTVDMIEKAQEDILED